MLLAVVTITGILKSTGSCLINGEKAKVSEAVLVSCALFTLTLPPATPYWVAAVGIAFGIVSVNAYPAASDETSLIRRWSADA